MTLDERIEIGKIQKEYSGFVKEMFTAADKFGIECKHCSSLKYLIYKFVYSSVPVDLSVKIKATLIGALFLIVSLNNT